VQDVVANYRYGFVNWADWSELLETSPLRQVPLSPQQSMFSERETSPNRLSNKSLTE
jgi:hypothetical protein